MPLVLAAVAEELGPLAGEAIGVGPVAAAAATARLLAIRRPARVLLLGTAGAYPGGPAVGEVVTVSRTGLGSGTAALGRGYVPRAPAPLAGVPAPGHRAATVLTCVAITTDPALGAVFGIDWEIEHMECFGVALACAHEGIPWTALLGVTNEVGPAAHAQWRANRDAMQAAVVAAAGAFMARRPPGG